MKKIIVSIIVLISVIIIYNIFKDDKIYYVSISDKSSIDSNTNYGYKDYIRDYLSEKDILENYIDIYSESDRITDVINNIKDNKKYDNRQFQNILIKADVLTITLGYEDIISKINRYNLYDLNKYIDSYLIDLEELFKILRKYDKEKIIITGFYNPYSEEYANSIISINKKIKNLSVKYNIDYVNSENIKNYVEEGNLLIEGQHVIFDEIRKIIDNKKKK